MEGSDALSALAEVAIGIAGFAAIALVLSRSRDSLSPDILLVVRTMIVNAVFVAFLALFPWVLVSGTLPPTEVWRWSSGVFVFGVIFVVSPVYIREQRALGPLQDTGLARLSLVNWSLAGLMLLVHVANLFGWPLSPSFSAFYLGLWLGLIVPGIAFVYLIYRLLR
jgi:hypothetical protein